MQESETLRKDGGALSNKRPPRILVVDDDSRLRDLLRQFLTNNGFHVSVAENAEQMNRLWLRERFDAVVLDVMMPGEDGISILKRIRASNDTTPILMLTAKDQEEDKVTGLQNGADDYLTKPFGLAELTARVNSLVRRYTKFNPHHEENQRLRFHDMTIDPSAHSVEVQGEPVSLTAREFDILLFLAQHNGRIFTKQQIYQNIWKEPYYQDDGNIMSIISKLRKKIEPDPEHPFYVLTVYGVGYRFNEKA